MERARKDERPRRSQRRRRRRRGRTLLVLLGLAGVLWGLMMARSPEFVQAQKDRWASFWARHGDVQARSLLVIERDSGQTILAKHQQEPCVPASLAKLYVIEYALTLADPDDVVEVEEAALAMTKPESSVADLEGKAYYLRDLLAAMLVPSGNDAAYAVADYCGSCLDPSAQPGPERVEVFMEHLRQYLRRQGYDDTVLYDPSGFDDVSCTTAEDLCAVTERLLADPWVRETVGQLWYAADLPDGSVQSWKNTNRFLEPLSDVYQENVAGVKTGSLPGEYHLMVLYCRNDREYLVCSLGSPTDTARYDDVAHVLRCIDETEIGEKR